MRKFLQLIFSALLLCCASQLHAQEAEPHNRGTLEGQNSENSSNTDTEISPRISKPDSVATVSKPVLVKPKVQSDKTSEKKSEESTFNFLYFIIQKFKSSDIIED
ncbi:MAG: hypothetical protein O9340_08320 [Cyclobacteriaceae bacterium]|jgi:hypothetical protein|nr:hypothetical protein [Cyclobacteriaceae bacterium]